MRSIVEISGGLFTAISGGDVTRRAIFEAYGKAGLGHLLWKRQYMDTRIAQASKERIRSSRHAHFAIHFAQLRERKAEFRGRAAKTLHLFG